MRSRRSTPGRRPLSSHSWSSSWAGTECEDLVQVMGGKGRARGEFMNPQGVTLTYKGDILVTDSNNQCVQVGPGLAGTETDLDVSRCSAAPGSSYRGGE